MLINYPIPMKSAEHKRTDFSRSESTDAKGKVADQAAPQLSGDDTMIYTLAHDIKSPINQVEGLLVIASKMNDSDELKGILQMALAANRDLSAKVNELLDMNIREKKHEAFDLGIMVSELWGSISSVNDNITVKLIHQCRIDHEVRTDKVRVKSILQNLIENAVKYRNPENENHSILINSFKDEKTVVIKVSDNGKGIRSNNLGKIFSASFQEDNTRNGHGMGLYLARKNAQTMGGNLEVQSQYGEGTTFTLTIPFKKPSAAA